MHRIQLIWDYYKITSRSFVGPIKFLVSGNTLQLKDHGKLDWEWLYFNPEEKHRHETVFSQECKKAYDMGTALV